MHYQQKNSSFTNIIKPETQKKKSRERTQMHGLMKMKKYLK
jgi:hypothetical protein